jgi:hypothetical protein
MQMSAADILTCPSLGTRRHQTSAVFTPPSPTPQVSVAKTLASSLDNGFSAESCEERSTLSGSLTSADPKKGVEVVRAGLVI